MKRLPFIALLLLITVASCKKDPFVDLIDTWDIEGGSKGEVTFNADGTGQAILIDYDFFSDLEFGILKNQCIDSDTSTFKWIVTLEKRDKGDLEITFDNDSTCTSTSTPRYNFYPGKNQVSLGRGIATFDIFRRK